MNFAPTRIFIKNCRTNRIVVLIISLLFSSFCSSAHASWFTAKKTFDTQAIKPYLAPYNQALYSIIHQEFEALRKKINHTEIARLTREIREKKDHDSEKLQNELDGLLRVFFTWHGEPTDVAHMAPTIYKILNDIFEETAHKSDIQMPDIAMHLTPSNNTLSNDALSAHAIAYSYHKFIDVGEEFFKLFIWNKQAIELLKAMLAHEFAHIKFDHNPSIQPVKNEHEADAFAVSILEQPKILMKALDMTLLENILNHVIHYHTTYPIHSVTEISRVLANYMADTLPKLGTFSQATTSRALANVLYTIVQQANIGSLKSCLKNGIDTHDAIFELADRITQASNNESLITAANKQACNTIEKHPGPHARQCHIENCIFAKK